MIHNWRDKVLTSCTFQNVTDQYAQSSRLAQKLLRSNICENVQGAHSKLKLKVQILLRKDQEKQSQQQLHNVLLQYILLSPEDFHLY